MNWPKLCTFLMLSIVLIHWTITSQAASFDCHKASSNIEQSICNDAALNKADTKLGQVYKQLRKQSSSADKNSLKREQKIWIKQRDKDCLPYDISCLIPLYESRIGVLRLRLSTLTTKSALSTDGNEKLTQSTKVMLKSMGPIKFGMTISEAEKASGLTFSANALTSKCSILIPQGEIGHDINFTAMDGKVMSVHVFAEGITTKSGIGVGNTEKELLKKYSKNIQLLDTVSSTGDMFKILAFVPKKDKNYRVIFVVHEGLIQDFSAGLMPYAKNRCESTRSKNDTNVSANNTTLVQLQGTWVSQEDDLYVLEISEQNWKDIYDGEPSTATQFKLVNGCGQNASHDPNGSYLETEDEFCYSIDNVDEESLTLMYLPRGNKLEFSKVE